VHDGPGPDGGGAANFSGFIPCFAGPIKKNLPRGGLGGWGGTRPGFLRPLPPSAPKKKGGDKKGGGGKGEAEDKKGKKEEGGEGGGKRGRGKGGGGREKRKKN